MAGEAGAQAVGEPAAGVVGLAARGVVEGEPELAPELPGASPGDAGVRRGGLQEGEQGGWPVVGWAAVGRAAVRRRRNGAVVDELKGGQVEQRGG